MVGTLGTDARKPYTSIDVLLRRIIPAHHYPNASKRNACIGHV